MARNKSLSDLLDIAVFINGMLHWIDGDTAQDLTTNCAESTIKCLKPARYERNLK